MGGCVGLFMVFDLVSLVLCGNSVLRDSTPLRPTPSVLKEVVPVRESIAAEVRLLNIYPSVALDLNGQVGWFVRVFVAAITAGR